MMDFAKYNLPVINEDQLTSLFANLLLWYDKPYCKSKEGALEVVGEYMKEVKNNNPQGGGE